MTGPDGASEGDDSSDGDDGESPDPGPWEPANGLPTDARVTETTVVADLEVPWDLTFAGGDAYFTEREVGLRRIDTEALLADQTLTADDAELIITPADLPDYENPPFGGFLGVAAHPAYPNPPAIYLYHSAAPDDDEENRLIRYGIERETVTTILDGIGGTKAHLGGRIEFGPEDDLWITVGESFEPEAAQNLDTFAGSILRITADGEAPPDNPGIDGADPRVVNYGHRNPQGLAFAPDGEVFHSDHGPSGRDEIAVNDLGANYGWPVARGGPADSEYDSYTEHEAFTPPVVNTGSDTTWAPSGAAFYTADAIGAWTNRLFVAGLISETLYAITLVREEMDDPPLGEDGIRYDEPWMDGRYTATAHPLYTGEYGRLRHVVQGPDGSLFLLTSNQDGRGAGDFPTDDDDRIIRIDPE